MIPSQLTRSQNKLTLISRNLTTSIRVSRARVRCVASTGSLRCGRRLLQHGSGLLWGSHDDPSLDVLLRLWSLLPFYFPHLHNNFHCCSRTPNPTPANIYRPGHRCLADPPSGSRTGSLVIRSRSRSPCKRWWLLEDLDQRLNIQLLEGQSRRRGTHLRTTSPDSSSKISCCAGCAPSPNANLLKARPAKLLCQRPHAGWNCLPLAVSPWCHVFSSYPCSSASE